MIEGQNVLTNSQEQCFMQCQRKCYWAYEMGWRPGRTKKPLRFGSAMHEVLDGLAKGMLWEAILQRLDDLYTDHVLDAADAPDPRTIQHELRLEQVTVECLGAGYATAYAYSPLEIMESEKSFNLPIINPDTGRASRTFRQAGKRDRYCQLPDGRNALLETKTMSNDLDAESDYRRVLALNQQVSKYMLAAQAEGLSPGTCIYDCIRKPTIKPTDQPERDEHGLVIVRDAQGDRVKKKNGEWRLTSDTAKGYASRKYPMTTEQWYSKLSADIATNPLKYYARFEVPRLASDLEEYRHELWWIAQAIQGCRLSGRWFRNTSACRNYNTLCAYYPLCAGEVDTSNGVPDGFRQVENVHEELVEPETKG